MVRLAASGTTLAATPPVTAHRLQLLGEGAAVEGDLAAGPLRHCVQYRFQPMNGVAAHERARRVRPHAGQ